VAYIVAVLVVDKAADIAVAADMAVRDHFAMVAGTVAKGHIAVAAGMAVRGHFAMVAGMSVRDHIMEAAAPVDRANFRSYHRT